MQNHTNLQATRYTPYAVLIVLLLLLSPPAVPARASVTLVSFTATPGNGQILLCWETATEINNAGFFVRRSTQEGGDYVRITPFMPAQGDGLLGAIYFYTDTTVTNGVTYFYKIEDVDNSQNTQFHGPISATPGQALTPTATGTFHVPSSTLTSTPTSTRNVEPGTPTGTPTFTLIPTPTATFQVPSPTFTPTPTLTPTWNVEHGTPTPPPPPTTASMSTPAPLPATVPSTPAQTPAITGAATPILAPTFITTNVPTPAPTNVNTNTPIPVLAANTSTPTSVATHISEPPRLPRPTVPARTNPAGLLAEPVDWVTWLVFGLLSLATLLVAGGLFIFIRRGRR